MRIAHSFQVGKSRRLGSSGSEGDGAGLPSRRSTETGRSMKESGQADSGGTRADPGWGRENSGGASPQGSPMAMGLY